MWTHRGCPEPTSCSLGPGSSTTRCSRRACVGCGVRSADPLPHQDLVFDLGDPVRWEYLLLETDKPHLSVTEEDDNDLNDDDDIKNLVRLSRL